MPDNGFSNDGFDNTNAPFVQSVPNQDLANKMIESDKLMDWLPKLDFITPSMATKVGLTVAKCLRIKDNSKRNNALQQVLSVALCWLSVEAKRSLLFGQIGSRLFAPGLYGDKDDNKRTLGRKNT